MGNPSTSAIYAWAERMRQRMLADYRQVQEAEYEAAAAATNGVMLTRRALDAGRDSWAVFHSGPTTLQALASEELLEYLEGHPRATRTEYERQWLDMFLGGSEQ